jgi:hypothetical protein
MVWRRRAFPAARRLGDAFTGRRCPKRNPLAAHVVASGGSMTGTAPLTPAPVLKAGGVELPGTERGRHAVDPLPHDPLVAQVAPQRAPGARYARSGPGGDPQGHQRRPALLGPSVSR